MTAGKRATTRKQTSADFSRHSQNYAFSVKTCSWKRKARTRRGWTWTGCPSCHTTLKRQSCSSVIWAKFCSDGSAVCGNKNSTSSRLWQRTPSQLCHAADCPILVESERIFLCPCEREILKSKSVLPLCRHHMWKREVFFGGGGRGNTRHVFSVTTHYPYHVSISFISWCKSYFPPLLTRSVYLILRPTLFTPLCQDLHPHPSIFGC